MKNITRRDFLQKSAYAGGLTLLPGFIIDNASKGEVMTVLGPVPARSMGFTLTHEHVLADFIGAEKHTKSRYDANEVYARALPFLTEIKNKGCSTFIDCTPAYLGRDVKLLQRIAQATGLHIMTTTGYYGAVKELFLPKHAYTETAQQLAARWIEEWKNGIEGTGIKPGLIKTSVDQAPLTAVQRKLIGAAALTHLATGLTIAIHTEGGAAADEQLMILNSYGVSPSARIWVHAQKEENKEDHIRTAKAGGWVSFDEVRPETLEQNLLRLQYMKQEKLLHRVLVSQDSGWYHVGEPQGGVFDSYSCILDKFIPLLRQNNFTEEEIDLLFKKNPAEAFIIRVRKG